MHSQDLKDHIQYLKNDYKTEIEKWEKIKSENEEKAKEAGKIITDLTLKLNSLLQDEKCLNSGE